MSTPAVREVPITRLAREHKQLLELLSGGPVTVTHHGTAVAVLVSIDTWNETQRRIWHLERPEMVERAIARIRAGEYYTAEEVDAGFKELGFE